MKRASICVLVFFLAAGTWHPRRAASVRCRSTTWPRSRTCAIRSARPTGRRSPSSCRRSTSRRTRAGSVPHLDHRPRRRGERQMTSSADSESSPRLSPDGKYLAFTSSRPGKAKGNQVWLLDRSGGEAVQLTEVKGRLQGYEWSPDSKRLALVIGDPDPERRHARRECRTGGGGRRAQGAQADRHRPLQVQAGRAGLSAVRSAQLHLSVRHRDAVSSIG